MDIQTAKDDFKTRLATKPSWSQLVNSELVDVLSAHMGWGLVAILDRCDRIEQEFFAATAINSSSILAQADFRNYTPRRKTPSTGFATIGNAQSSMVIIPAFTELLSNENGYKYRTRETVQIPAGAVATVAIEQAFVEQITTTMPGPVGSPYTEFAINGRTWDTVKSIRVFVGTTIANQLEWPQKRLFRNAGPNTPAWDEFHGWDNSYGIRFGNGNTLATPNGTSGAGLIPSVADLITINLEITNGATELTSGRELKFTTDIKDVLGVIAKLECYTITAIAGGANEEGIAEIKSNLRYWSIYDDEAVFKSDYEFFLRRKYPTLIWLKVWGEKDELAITGIPSISAINAVFISGYRLLDSNDDPDPEAEIELVDALKTVLPLNCRAVWKAPEVTWFHIRIDGIVESGTAIADAIALIEDAILAEWGLLARGRSDDPNPSQVYKTVESTGIFDKQQEHFEIILNPTAQTGHPYTREGVDFTEIMQTGLNFTATFGAHPCSLTNISFQANPTNHPYTLSGPTFSAYVGGPTPPIAQITNIPAGWGTANITVRFSKPAGTWLPGPLSTDIDYRLQYVSGTTWNIYVEGGGPVYFTMDGTNTSFASVYEASPAQLANTLITLPTATWGTAPLVVKFTPGVGVTLPSPLDANTEYKITNQPGLQTWAISLTDDTPIQLVRNVTLATSTVAEQNPALRTPALIEIPVVSAFCKAVTGTSNPTEYHDLVAKFTAATGETLPDPISGASTYILRNQAGTNLWEILAFGTELPITLQANVALANSTAIMELTPAMITLPTADWGTQPIIVRFSAGTGAQLPAPLTDIIDYRLIPAGLNTWQITIQPTDENGSPEPVTLTSKGALTNVRVTVTEQYPVLLAAEIPDRTGMNNIIATKRENITVNLEYA